MCQQMNCRPHYPIGTLHISALGSTIIITCERFSWNSIEAEQSVQYVSCYSLIFERKRRKMSSKPSNKRKQSFKSEYSAKWNFIQPSKKGENHAKCTLCAVDFTIANSGSYDISQHIKTAKHQSNAEKLKKYIFLMQNTGFGVSEYRFVIPEVGRSGKRWCMDMKLGGVN